MGMESGLVHAYQFSLRGRSRSLLPNQVGSNDQASIFINKKDAFVDLELKQAISKQDPMLCF
jgi:hypothetical protein